MVDAEMVKEALRICTQSGTITCVNCPYFNDMTCVNSLASDAAEYIESLEERISIMQESMAALEKRDEPIKPIVKKEQDNVDSGLYDIRYCSKCKNRLGWLKKNFCCECGQAVKWE